MDVIWDMETGDPDDFVTLLFLLGHPKVNLKAVTITPGGADQVGLVRWALHQFERYDVRVGTFLPPLDLDRQDFAQVGKHKSRVSAWHYKVYGNISRDHGAESAVRILREELGPDTTLITGGPLKNLGALLREGGDSPLGRLFVQGGFAGEGVVPRENQLEKFQGMVTCPTYNLNGDPTSALLVVGTDRFSEKRFVSKNVCHGVRYNMDMHMRFLLRQTQVCSHEKCRCPCHSDPGVMHIMACCQPCPACGENTNDLVFPNQFAHALSLSLITKGMAKYLAKDSQGKKCHDPLAAACAIDPEIGTWEEVYLYREKGKWGSKIAPGTGLQIITGYDRERFISVFTGK